ncbi:MAG: methyl-accepting chemotaxis protein [Gammaproteobacteria bacterium]|nr:methyl-accepting chemotaxis protein [Gammaproteobacteria bacterium]
MVAFTPKGSSLLIKHKIWLGFSTVLFIMLVISLLAFSSLNKVNQSVTTVVEENQPMVIASLELSENLHKANGFLGFYLLSKEEAHKKAYIEAIQQIEKIYQKLKTVSKGDAQKTVSVLGENINKFTSYKDKMLVLPTDLTLNFPAFKYSADNLNPFAQTTLQILGEMILSEDEEDPSQERKELLNDIQYFRYSWSILLNDIRIFLNQPVDSNLSNLENSLSRVPGLIEKLEAKTDLFTFEQEEGFPKIKESSSTFLKNAAVMITMQRGEKRRMDAYIIRNELGPIVEKIESALSQIVKQQQTAITENSHDLIYEVKSGINLQFILLIIGLSLGVIAAWMISRMITKNLNTAVEAMRDVAEGEGDLTKRLEVKGNDEIAQLSTAFNTFSGKVAALVAEVAGVTTQLSSAASEMNQLTGKTQQAMTTQVEKVNTVSASMTEISQQVDDISQSSEQAAEISRQTDEESSEGKRIVKEGISIISKLKQDFEGATTTVQAVEEDAESIGSVLDVIQGIAEQTNLLALNAAIEAARAGEQGRGFAVVADEVRTLASRTQDSTLEIKTIIERLQVGSSKAAQVMKHGTEQVQTSVDSTNNVGNSLEKISKSVAKMNTMNNQIAAATVEHSAVSEQVDQGVNDISGVALEASDDVEQIATSSQGVSELTQKLESLVGQFHY